MLCVINFSWCLLDVFDLNEDIVFYIFGWRLLVNYINGYYMYEYFYMFCFELWWYIEFIFGIDKYLVFYGGRGYIVKFGYDIDIVLKVKRNIEYNFWIDDKLGVVIVEFVVFEFVS